MDGILLAFDAVVVGLTAYCWLVGWLLSKH